MISNIGHFPLAVLGEKSRPDLPESERDLGIKLGAKWALTPLQGLKEVDDGTAATDTTGQPLVIRSQPYVLDEGGYGHRAISRCPRGSSP